MHENIVLSTKDNKTKIVYNMTKSIQGNRNDQGKQTDYQYMEKNITITDHNEKDDDKNILITTDTSNDMLMTQWMETSTAYTPPAPTSKPTPQRKTTPGNSASALSAILAPSNSNLTSKINFNKRPATITKVNLSNLEPYDPDGTYLPVNNREGKTGFTNRNTNTNVKKKYGDKNMDWYYKNYNKSNLEPYVAPGVVKSQAMASHHVTTYLLFIVTVILNLCW